MGMELPSPDSPREQVRVLMARKSDIQAELETHLSILKANSSTMHSPLVDPDGFPRADIDIYAVRGARIRVIELRNDLEALMNEIGKKLESVYDPSLAPPAVQESDSPADTPFARVDGVAPGSPAADAGLKREDLIVKFGSLTSPSSLQAVAEAVGANENQSISIKVLRDNRPAFLSLTPRKGWGGRGMLGYAVMLSLCF
ncbi:uncharacterized protein BT62DRAFT_896475 [Guyanagaster necrorhizus]|uniref:Probable 26S proteasome regulatory subunit p27 n=1 Tax=Guyanagaster necrorhizus TaxID=856835 RepID=A0A9P7VQU9_9AGAR|nr:uncharacterized protein BT62DRAFT_896475 [Guyanagaster necrorhizus MCA 3950]KAG7445756.1 hypothetical protein BT62DRAFT_896475 [Guyanagaster necrorhizus MCA 3950]